MLPRAKPNASWLPGQEVPSREFDPQINPYAGALREPGQARRTWEPRFLQGLAIVRTNGPIEFELAGGEIAIGVLTMLRLADGEVTYAAGELTKPEPGKFFFLKPPNGSKAGQSVGVVEFWGSQTAYRIEPTGPDGAPELWKRRLDEVLCLSLPLEDEQLPTDGDVAELAVLRPDAVPDYSPEYNSNIVSLQSYPGSSAVLLLDFFGGSTPTWGGVTYPRPKVSNAQIRDVWKRISEDYLPFNINVTTDLRVYENASPASRQRCVFSPSVSAMPSGSAGVAYVGSWNWGNDTVCWSIYTSGKSAAEVGSHEVGHTLGLAHQGSSTSGYFVGHGSGPTGWGPIMGAGYYRNVTTFAKGEYYDANNHEDELQLITTQNNNVQARLDDTGSVLNTASYLEVYPDGGAWAEGVIERTGDTDAFRFNTSGGAISLNATPVGDWANLAICATLANSGDFIIASNNPQSTLSAAIDATLEPGTYTFRVTGAGRNNALYDGFSSYGSLGYYSITGSVAGALLPLRFTVQDHAPVGTLVGTVYPANPGGKSAYSIASGNPGGTFAIDANGAIRVANSSLLDYARMATATTTGPPQFELFVNLTDPANPSLSEVNRRVVISLSNVNDAPQITGFARSVLAHTLPGTILGTVWVQDSDLYQQCVLRIIDGDPDNVFAIDQAGLISVRGDLNPAIRSNYSLTITASDDDLLNPLISTGHVNINIVTNLTPFRPGNVSYASYAAIGSGTSINDLIKDSRWPRDPTSELQLNALEAPANSGDNFGAALRGYLIPPQSGSYTFWIAGDESCELWLSPTTNSANASKVAYLTSASSAREWTKYNSQRSAAISLSAGQAYYLEARMKEATGSDHLAVAWRGPATSNQIQIVSALYVAPFPMNFLPHASGFAANVRKGAYSGAILGTIVVSDANAYDRHTFAITGGFGSLFRVDPQTGQMFVADENALASALPGEYTITVTVTDSGSPPLSANAAASINLIGQELPVAPKLRREIWSNIGNGCAVSDLTNHSAFPARPDKLEDLTGLGSSANVADNYGSRIRALLCPPATGEYRFFIASDESSSLLLSPDENSSNAVRIASVTGWTLPNAWTRTAQQISPAQPLVAGQRYYLEVLHKEGFSSDHVEVAWAGPGIVGTNNEPATNIIASAFLSPVDLNYPPTFPSQSLFVFTSVTNGTPIGIVTATDSPLDRLSYKILAGNPGGTFSINTASGVISVVDNTRIADGSVSTFSLIVAVQDSGYGGLYLPQTAQAEVTINVRNPAAEQFAWTGAASANRWSDPGNWGGALPPEGAALVFGFPSQQQNQNDLIGYAKWVVLTNSGFAISGRPLSILSGLTNRGDNLWAVDTLLAGPQTWHNAAGTLSITGAVNLGDSPLTLLSDSGIRISGSIAGEGGLSKTGSGRLILSGAHSYLGPTIIGSSGTNTSFEVGASDLLLASSDLVLEGRMDLGNHNAIVGALNGSGMIFASDLTRTLTVGANGHSGAFTGVLLNNPPGSATGSTLNLVKTGAGTQLLGGTNSYSGLTVVNAGTLLLANSKALGTAAGGTFVGAGATLALRNNISLDCELVNLSGRGVDESGALRNDDGTNEMGGPIGIQGPVKIRSTQGRLTLRGTWVSAGNDAPLTFDTAAGAEISVSGGIEGAGALHKTGPGTLFLAGTNYYLGVTTVSEGTLSLASRTAILRSSGFVIHSGGCLDISSVPEGWSLLPGQLLQGPGLITGSATVQGLLLPGSVIGTLTFSGDLTLSGSLAIRLSKSGTTLTNDVLACSGTLTAGGILNVTHTGPDPLGRGDTFKLITARAYANGAYSGVNLPPLEPGLTWDTSKLIAEGTLRIAGPEPPPLSLIVLSTSGQPCLLLSWPGEYSDYLLETQTNALDDEWFPVSGVVSNRIVIPIDTANAAAFYRLVKP